MTEAAPSLPGGREARSLEIARVKVRLRLREQTELGFHHGGLLHRLLERCCGGPPPSGLFPLALESGHVHYGESAAYDLALTAVGEDRRHLEALAPNLRAIGAGARPRRRGPRAESLEGLFELVSIEKLELPSLEQCAAKAADLAARGRVRLLLTSPLRLRPSREEDPLAGQRLGAAAFPAGLLLAGLWRRYHHLAGLPPIPPPALPPETRVVAEHLTRHDLQLRLDRQTGSGPAPATTSGLGGELVFENLPHSWLLLLALMEAVHAGTATELGFGAYALDRLPTWQRPAATYQEALWPDAATSEGAATLLQPAALAHLDEAPASQCRGLAQVTAELGLLQARQQGLNGPVGGAGDRFVASLGEAKILARLRSFFPGEPLVELFPTWLQYAEDRHSLSRLLAKVFAVELADELQQEGRRLVRMGSELRVLGRQAARVA